MDKPVAHAPSLADRQYELLLRLLYEGLQAGEKVRQALTFKESRIHKVLPFLLEDLAIAHIRGLGFTKSPDRTYPAITRAIKCMHQRGYIRIEGNSASGESIYRITPYAEETLPRLFRECAILHPEEISALHESFPRAVRAFLRNVKYEECVAETGYL